MAYPANVSGSPNLRSSSPTRNRYLERATERASESTQITITDTTRDVDDICSIFESQQA
jgi:hypothetical protein